MQPACQGTSKGGDAYHWAAKLESAAGVPGAIGLRPQTRKGTRMALDHRQTPCPVLDRVALLVPVRPLSNYLLLGDSLVGQVV